jgi:osmotically-inducible protein OsmY
MQSKELVGRALAALLMAGGVCLAFATPASAGPAGQTRSGTAAHSSRSANLDDRELARAIEKDLRDAQMVDLDDVRVDVRNGTVTLTGEVDSALARERALRIARMYGNVDEVVDRLSVRTASRTDDQLKADVERMFERHSSLDRHDIEVDVKQGAVTLTGEAGTYRDRRLANDLAESVAGVRRVDNRIEVQRNGSDLREDALIRQDIERRIGRSCGHCDVDVTVNQGRVKLDGSVPSGADRRELLDMVWVPGVVEVDDDELKIDFGERAASRTDARDENRRVRGHEGRGTRRTDVERDRDRDRERMGERRASYRRDDAALARELRDEFRDDPIFSRNAPQVRVDDGVVYLTGTVDSVRAKRRAGEIAEDLPGVDRVRNDLRVSDRPGMRGNGTRDSRVDTDDDAIQRRIEQALYDDPFFNRHQIRVQVEDGVVRLTGRVPSERERAAAEDIALSVEGVEDVDNDLIVSN